MLYSSKKNEIKRTEEAKKKSGAGENERENRHLAWSVCKVAGEENIKHNLIEFFHSHLIWEIAFAAFFLFLEMLRFTF